MFLAPFLLLPTLKLKIKPKIFHLRRSHLSHLISDCRFFLCQTILSVWKILFPLKKCQKIECVGCLPWRHQVRELYPLNIITFHLPPIQLGQLFGCLSLTLSQIVLRDKALLHSQIRPALHSPVNSHDITFYRQRMPRRFCRSASFMTFDTSFV